MPQSLQLLITQCKKNGHFNLNIPVPRSVTPMGNVTKYLQKLGMGVYDNENQLGVSKKITRI